jgi:hypothetical protein
VGGLEIGVPVARLRLDEQLTQAIAVRIRERVEQDGVDHREHRGGAADAERQRQDDEHEHSGAAAHTPPRVGYRT